MSLKNIPVSHRVTIEMESDLNITAPIRSGGRYTLPPHFQESDNRQLDNEHHLSKIDWLYRQALQADQRKFLTSLQVLTPFCFFFVSAHAHTHFAHSASLLQTQAYISDRSL